VYAATFLTENSLFDSRKDLKSEWVHFGSENFRNWGAILDYLKIKI